MSTTSLSIIGIIFVVLFTAGTIIYYAYRKNDFGDRVGYTWPILISVLIIVAYGVLGIMFTLSLAQT